MKHFHFWFNAKVVNQSPLSRLFISIYQANSFTIGFGLLFLFGDLILTTIRCFLGVGTFGLPWFCVLNLFIPMFVTGRGWTGFACCSSRIHSWLERYIRLDFYYWWMVPVNIYCADANLVSLWTRSIFLVGLCHPWIVVILWINIVRLNLYLNVLFLFIRLFFFLSRWQCQGRFDCLEIIWEYITVISYILYSGPVVLIWWRVISFQPNT